MQLNQTGQGMLSDLQERVSKLKVKDKLEWLSTRMSNTVQGISLFRVVEQKAEEDIETEEETALHMPDVLLSVMGHLDPKTLALTAPLVSKFWKETARAKDVWASKLDNKELVLVNHLCSLGPRISLPAFHLAMHSFNFLRNPGFVKSHNARLDSTGISPYKRNVWVVTADGDGTLVWEVKPENIPPLDPNSLLPYPYSSSTIMTARFGAKLRGMVAPEVAGCVATGDNWCQLVQVVNLSHELQQRGMTEKQAAAVLDSGLSLGLSIMVGCRSDQLGVFGVGLFLDDGSDSSVSLQGFPRRPSSAQYFSGVLRARPGAWVRFATTISPTPAGFRRAVVILRGRAGFKSTPAEPPESMAGEPPETLVTDITAESTAEGSKAESPPSRPESSFFARNAGKGTGTKFACAVLRFVGNQESHDFGLEESQEYWSTRIHD